MPGVIIAVAVHDTIENGRTEYTKKTLESLRRSVNWKRHKLVIIDNGSCEATKKVIKDCVLDSIAMPDGLEAIKPTIVTLSENVGTAKAINFAIHLRKPGQAVCKLDNDVVVPYRGWVDEMLEVIERDPMIGIVGLKRKDLRQTPYDPDPQFKSTLYQLPHEAGQRWITVELSSDIMGTCTMLSSALINKVGGYHQIGKYGFDDTLMSLRAGLAGFKKCFLPHIPIEHIDDGNNTYSQEKVELANKAWEGYQRLHMEYCNGIRPIYEEI